jgi:protein SCO1/2
MNSSSGDSYFATGENQPKGVLIDQYGRPMPASKLSGHYLLVYFGYTSCPDICPTALTTISSTLDLIGLQRENVLPLFVTVDPARDTVAVMRSYVAHFNRRLIGLTGSPGAIAAARMAFDVSARQGRPDETGNYAFDHSLFIYFAGPDGKVLQTFHANQSAASIASEMLKLLPAAGPASDGAP